MIGDFEKIEKQYAHEKTKLMFYLMMTNNTKIKRLTKTDKEYILNILIRIYTYEDDVDIFKLIDVVGNNLSDIITNDLSSREIINLYDIEVE